jgi:hypothetical protein
MRYQLRLLLLSVAAVVLIIVGAFFSDWFAIHVASQDVLIDLRHIRVCAPQCSSSSVDDLGGTYPGAAALAFWTALPLFVVLATQAGSRLLSGYAYPILTTIGTGLGTVAFFSAFAAGFLAPPDGTALAGFELTVVERMSGPIFLVLGALAGLVTVRYAAIELDEPPEYRPVVIPPPGDSKDGTTRLPVTPISTNKLPTPVAGGRELRSSTVAPDARAKSPTTPPDLRVKSPTTPPDARVKSPTTPPDARVKSPTTPPDARAKSPTTPPDARLKSPTTPPDARVKSPTTPPDALAKTTQPAERAKPLTGQQPAVPRTVSTTAPETRRTTGQIPTTPPETRRTTAQIPLIGRTALPTNPPVVVIPPASGPIDVSARLGAAPLDTEAPSVAPPSNSIDVSARLGASSITESLSVGSGDSIAIRPPLPVPPPLPDDQIPVAPESGLVIRKRSPSVVPEAVELPLPPDIGLAIRTRAPSVAPPPMMASVASALGVEPPSTVSPPTPVPEPLRSPEPLGRPTPVPGLVKYAVTRADLTSAGIRATREDGVSKLIKWDAIVGLVARRLPQPRPYDGLSFVDIVSAAGATMRILPSTEITGHPLDGDHDDHTERARAIVNLLAAMALDAKLDSATKVFANGTSKAAQLKDEKTLATHDERLA